MAIELTAHCNQKCNYCYNGWREDNGGALADATTDQLLGRTRKMLQAWDIDHVTLTGGEPFSRTDIWQLFDLLAEHGVAAQIISNGGLITFPGGIPLTTENGTVIGAIGVSGSTVENDHLVAEAGANALR